MSSTEQIATRNHGGDSPYQVAHIQEIVDRIQNRTHFDAVPSDSLERELWYQGLEKVILNIVGELKKLERENRGDEIAMALTSLDEMAAWCGSQWKSHSLSILQKLKGTAKDVSIEDQALEQITAFRLSIVHELAKPQNRFFGEDVNAHALNEATYQINRRIRLPGGENSNHDTGVFMYHPESYWNTNFFPREFFKRYTKERIVDHFDELINGLKKDGRKTDVQLKRDPLVDWFRKTVGEEGAMEIFEMRNNLGCIKRSAIEYFLCKIGVINQAHPDQTPEREFLGADYHPEEEKKE